jgi:BirA family biotin operon repressor/biotin-[acetyl-CoA-carboxylase] ligase
MSSPYADLDRPPLPATALARDLGGGLWREVRVVAEVPSTNAVVAAEARAGAAEGLVVVAERQTAGRGRLGRTWETPTRAGLTFSMLLRPSAPPAVWSLASLFVATAVVEAVRGVAHVDATVKWPNDVLTPSGGKVAGLLAEAADGALVVGVGLNVSTRRDELPVATATSLAVEGARSLDRAVLLKEILRAVERRYRTWIGANGAPEAVLPPYREICETIGRHVRLELPGGAAVTGTVTGVDDAGRVVVRDYAGLERPWAAGDVVHLRAEA